MKTVFIATRGTGIDLSLRAYGFYVFVRPHFHDVLDKASVSWIYSGCFWLPAFSDTFSDTG
jgi:hypothetical protein